MSTPLATEGAEAICAREPIQFSGAIQPHGWLLCCSMPDWTVRHASANIAALLDVEAAALIGEGLRDHVNDDLLQAVADTMNFSEIGAQPQRAAVGNVGPMAQLCDVSVHVAEGLVHIEIELQGSGSRERTPTVVAQAMISRVVSTVDAVDFHQRTAEQVRSLCGFDRVMVYRFRDDDSGEVVAEAVADDLEPYLGLRYPASDIPVQARQLYLRNRLRVIPDAAYTPVPVLPAVTAAGTPLDLSQHALRSVSPVHLEYMRNMGVAASMSVSIISGGRLWGLIACHHRVARRVPPSVRAAADLFGMFVSMRISARDQQAAIARDDAAREVREQLTLQLAGREDVDAALRDALPLLRRAIPSDGVALWIDGVWRGAGHTPSAAQAEALLAWLARHDQTRPSMTHVAADWSGVADPAGLAGMLAIPLSARDGWLFYFRAEQLQDVRWAGDPTKAVSVGDDGTRIAPRKSFASWREMVRGHSEPWRDGDVRAAARLRLLLREHQRQRPITGGPGGEVADLDAFRRRHVLRDQKSRLDQLSAMLEGLVHVEDHEAARLGDRIAELEADLRALMVPGTRIAD